MLNRAQTGLFFGLLLALVPLGCNSDSVGCKNDIDCPGTHLCIDGVCCPAGTYCCAEGCCW